MQKSQKPYHHLFGIPFLLPVLLGSASCATGQGFSIVSQGQLVANRPVLRSSDVVHDRVNLKTRFDSRWGLGLQYQVSPQVAVKVLLHAVNFGTSIQLRERDNQPPDQLLPGIGSRRSNGLGASLLFDYKLLNPATRGHWVLQTGVDMVHRPIGPVAYDCGVNPPDVPGPNLLNGGMKLTFLSGTPTRFGARIGIGREWAITKRHYVQVMGVYSIGLQTFSKECLEYVLPDPATGQETFYHHHLRNKLSAAGIEVGYRFAFN